MKKFILLFALSAYALHGATLANRHVAIDFDENRNFAIRSITNKQTGRTIKCAPEKDNGLWTLYLYNGNVYTAFSAPEGSRPVATSGVEPDGTGKLIINWRKMSAGKGQLVDVQAVIKLAPESKTADCKLNIDISGTPAPLWVFRYTFPEIHNAASLGDDYLIWGFHYGRLIRSPGNKINSAFGDPWDSAFAAFYGSEKHRGAIQEINTHPAYRANGYLRGQAPDETALLVMADDKEGMHKYIRFTPGSTGEGFSILPEHYPAYPDWPKSNYRKQSISVTLPYHVKIGTVAGGMGASINAYREMVKDHPFLKRGKIHDPAAGYSPKIKDNVFWGKFYFAANKVVRDIAEYHQYLQVPVNIFWYRYYTNLFDDHNLDYLPTMGFFREGVRALKDLNIGMTPYICYGIWDINAESFDRKNVISAAALNTGGKAVEWRFDYLPYREIINHFLNPSAPLTHNEYLKVSGKIQGQFGAAGQYCDVLASLRKLCYSKEFNAVNGGNYWLAGANKTAAELRSMAVKLNPEAVITSESFNEYYIGNIDAFLMLDMTREAPVSFGSGNNIEVYPVSSMMFHDYTTFFGGDGNPAERGEFTRWLLGTYFSQGMQLAYGSIALPVPGTAKDGNDLFLRELCRSWYQSGGKFLNGGKHLETEILKTEKFLGTSPLSIVSPQEISIPGKIPIVSPAILGGAWLALDGSLGVNLVNITDREISAKIIIRPQSAGCQARQVWQTWPLPVKSCGRISADGSYTTEIKFPPRGVVMFELNERKPQPRELLNITSFAVYSDPEKGTFPTVTRSADKLYISDETMTENNISNGQNIIRLRNSTDGRLRVNHSSKCNWVQQSGRGGSRQKTDRSFHVLQTAPLTFAGNGMLFLHGSPQALYGRLKTVAGGELAAADGKTLLINIDGEIKFFSTGKVKLAPGTYHFAVFSGYAPRPGESAEDFASELSFRAAETGGKLLNAVLLTEANRIAGENALTIGNGAAYVLTNGARLINTTPTDEAVFGLVKELDYDFTYAQKIIDSDCRVLNDELSGYYDLRTLTPLKNTIQTLDLEGANNMVRILKSVRTQNTGNRQVLFTDLSYLETVEPMLMTITPPEIIRFGNGDGNVSVKLYIRNVSNTDLPLTLKAILPNRSWKCHPVNLTMKKLAAADVRLTIEPPAGFEGKIRIPFKLTYAGFEGGKTHEYLDFTVKKLDFRPVVPAGNTGKSQIQKSLPRLRHGINAVVIAGDDRTIEVDLTGETSGWAAIKNVTYSITSATPKKMPVASGVINLDASGHGKLKISVPAPGAYFVDFKAKWCRYDFKNRHYGIFASGNTPLNFSNADHDLYFYVKPGVKEFLIGGIDGGAAETVELTVSTPDDTVAWTHAGNISRGEMFPVAVPQGMDGKVWRIKVCNVDDFALILGEGISQLISLDPAAVIND
ncbi:MAG: hypothetical protein IKA71_00350 [Lentisphaeria bacterium]|nr:hypothetical protein [Lentisphaeria bacterium]